MANQEIPNGNVTTKENVVEDSDSSDLENSNDKKKWRCSRKYLVVTALGMGNVLAGACISLQAPFFPKEAEKKGATSFEYGLVFGIFQLTMLLISPIYGLLVVYVSPKFMINAGLFLVGSCSVIFGFLDRSPDGLIFVCLAMAVRIMEGLGTAAFATASYTITTSEFTENVAVMFGTLATLYGIGLTIGPALGGGLYDLGGYTLPFLVVGIIILSCNVITMFMLPSPDNVVQLKSGNMKKFWLNGGLILYALTVVLVFMGTSYNSATLEPHLRKFNLDASVIGLIFVIPGFVLVFIGPLVGRLIDKKPYYRPFGLFGMVLQLIGYSFIGPQPFFPFQEQLWLVIVSQVILGFGYNFSLISSFAGSLKDTIKRGFPNDLSTYGLVSSMYSSSNSLGAFVGPTLGGWLLEKFGYRWGTTVISSCQLLLVIALIIYIAVSACENSKPKTDPDVAPILPENGQIPDSEKDDIVEDGPLMINVEKE